MIGAVRTFCHRPHRFHGRQMNRSVQEALDALSGLAAPEELRALAAEGLAPAGRPRVNSHIHLPPNFSAFESVEQAVDLAAEQGVGVLGVSNYYDYEVYGEFAALARRRDIFPLFGLEIIALIDELVRGGVLINDPGNPGRIYICGKGITAFADMTGRARELIGVIRGADDARMAEMTAKVEAIFAAHGVSTGLDAEAVIDMVVSRHGSRREAVTLQERHVAQGFQEALFEAVGAADRTAKLGEILGAAVKAGPDDHVAIQGEIRSHLMKAGKPAFVAETFLPFEQAHELILEMGGIPCYPTLADGADPICPYERPVEKLIENINGLEVHMAEFIPIRNTPEVLSRYAKAMRAAGIVLVAGTEHNTLDLLPIEPACLHAAPIPDELKDVFWEGACVAAAHQFLALHGQCGYVDARGRPNPAFGGDEERIAAFAALGAAVIQRYHENR